jgi:hypothetical protein
MAAIRLAVHSAAVAVQQDPVEQEQQADPEHL